MSPPIRRRAANFARPVVLWRIGSRSENRTLVVILTTLQLLLVVVAWLLAIVPAGLLALGVMAWKKARVALRRD